MPCPCSEHGMCPLDRVRVLEARVAALEQHIIPGNPSWKVPDVVIVNGAGGPEAAGVEHLKEPSSSPTENGQQRDSRPAPAQQVKVSGVATGCIEAETIWGEPAPAQAAPPAQQPDICRIHGPHHRWDYWHDHRRCRKCGQYEPAQQPDSPEPMTAPEPAGDDGAEARPQQPRSGEGVR